MTSEMPKDRSRGTAKVDHEKDVFSIPNVITVLRLTLIPVFYWFLVFDAPGPGTRNDAAFLFFTICAGTDWLDGWIARKTGHVTALGKIIDPLVDRLLIASALVGLYFSGAIGPLLMMLLIGRDVYLLYGAWVLERHHGQRIPVSFLGKLTTAVLLAGFASLIWRYPLVTLPVLAQFDLAITHIQIGGIQPVGVYLVYMGVVISLATAVQYTVIARRNYRVALEAEARGQAHDAPRGVEG